MPVLYNCMHRVGTFFSGVQHLQKEKLTILFGAEQKVSIQSLFYVITF